MKKNTKVFVGDFETTVYDGQTSTEVWASAIVEINTEDVKIFHSIGDTFDYLTSLKSSIIVYYHNLKFDGSFWLHYFLNVKKFKQASITDEDLIDVEMVRTKDMENNSFNYVISSTGSWYSIRVKINNKIIEFRDSLKLLPFSVKVIGNSFKTKHRKLDMEYKGFRYSGCEITDEEKHYIANDVLVVKEALEIMFSQGHDRLTIGSCCLAEYNNIIGKDSQKTWFPDMYDIELNKEEFGSENADEYIRKSYKGGWCYLVKGKENKRFHGGITADVNSLYPSMMSSQSGNFYPVGKPHFWKGDIPKEALINERYFFIRIRTQFYIKKNKLPFVQMKNTLLYTGTESLETSDLYDPKTDKYYSRFIDYDGKEKDVKVELTLTCTDWCLLNEHYTLKNLEILDGCWFYAEKGIFDEYIEKYKKQKMESKGALRQLAKLFLNNLYGKLASSKASNFKYAVTKEDGVISFVNIKANDKKAGYIPCGSAITSYARNFTIRAAQKNFYGKDKRGFIYADTDSIHCDLTPQELVDIPIHQTDFCHWKLETSWDEAIFVRQKTYIEHVTHEDLNVVEPYYNIKCAGMPPKCKALFDYSLRWKEFDEQGKEEIRSKFNENEIRFIEKNYTLDDFKIGLLVPGKLIPKRIYGGVLLVETTYEMRG